MSDWMFLQQPPGQGAPGWGGGGHPVRFRDSLDARRSGVGQVPSAQLPGRLTSPPSGPAARTGCWTA